MTPQDALQILQSRIKIDEPGMYQLKVTNVHPHIDENRGPIQITNFNGMTLYQKDNALALIRQGDIQGALNENFSASPRMNGKDFLPVKGQYVDVLVGWVTSKKGITSLQALAITPIAAKKAEKFDMNEFERALNAVESPVFDNEVVEG